MHLHLYRCDCIHMSILMHLHKSVDWRHDRYTEQNGDPHLGAPDEGAAVGAHVDRAIVEGGRSAASRVVRRSLGGRACRDEWPPAIRAGASHAARAVQSL